MPFFRNPFSRPPMPSASRAAFAEPSAAAPAPLPTASHAPALGSLPSSTLTDGDYKAFCDLIYQYSRIALGPNKKEMMAGRLWKRLRACNLPDFSSYLSLLSSPKGKDELTHFVDAISTNHTFFFREVAHFEFLKNVILPGAVKNPPSVGNPEFRVWSAACSSGEEPYSAAIVIDEFLKKYPDWSWSIEATDISNHILSQARLGTYERVRLGTMSPQHMQTYFQKANLAGGDAYQISQFIKAFITFKQLNLLGAAYRAPKPFDLIFCRNVMIYFDRDTKQELINRLIQNLRPGGYLFIGHAESLTNIQHSLKIIQPAVLQKSHDS